MVKKKKLLDVQDVANLLQISVVKVQRWIHQGKIPCKFQSGRFCFRFHELLEWARMHDFHVDLKQEEKLLGPVGGSHPLASAVQRGGVVFGLEGNDTYCVLKAAAEHVRLDPPTEAERVLEELLAREELASTGIGRGVAIPHPRHMLKLVTRPSQVPVFFLKEPVDFSAVDGRPVDILFVMFSPDTPTHLELLSRLGFLLRDEAFPDALRGCNTAQEVVACLEAGEDRISADHRSGGKR